MYIMYIVHNVFIPAQQGRSCWVNLTHLRSPTAIACLINYCMLRCACRAWQATHSKMYMYNEVKMCAWGYAWNYEYTYTVLLYVRCTVVTCMWYQHVSCVHDLSTVINISSCAIPACHISLRFDYTHTYTCTCSCLCMWHASKDSHTRTHTD